MNAKTIALAVAVVLGLWLLLSSRATAPTTPALTTPTATSTATSTSPVTQSKTTSEPTKAPVTKQATTVRKALLPFLSSSQSTKCSYETVNGPNRTSSQLYMSKGVLRGEFRSWSGTTATTDFVHYDGSYAYTWKEGFSTGNKKLVNTLADIPAIIPRDLTGGSVLGTATNNASWDCHQWIVESDKMTLPAYVQFK
jgi:hypothetical protein